MRATKVAFDLSRTPITGIGLMCGTSHDALDIAIVSFLRPNTHWDFNLLNSASYQLPKELKASLAGATEMSALEYVQLDRNFAIFCAESIDDFRSTYSGNIEFIASHGATVFHQPQNGLTTQIGSGAIISALTGFPVVSDFRAQDVTKGGQGAPLVPFADKMLFSNYTATLNLGGFANLSVLNQPELIGFDISPCNKALNHIYTSSQLEGEFDLNGNLAKTGMVLKPLLDSLNSIKFYKAKPPKSLGHEWFISDFLPIISTNNQTSDLLATITEHIALQIVQNLPIEGSVLITGGGAFNSFLLERIQKLSNCTCVIPDPSIIDYKEAIEFAFLGALRIINQLNIDKTVTGASSNSIAGALYLP